LSFLPEINLKFNKNYGKWFLNDVIHAISRYGMIDDGEHICVALSGGKDSATLAYILAYLTRYSHLKFTLSALHIKTGEYDAGVLKALCGRLDIQYLESRITPQQEDSDQSLCYICTRLKRGAMSRLLAQQGIRKIAYGHHADDVTETFFMNMVQNRKMGSFSPKVEVPESDMVVIRPIVYLQEATIQRVHQYLNLPILNWHCPHAETNIRDCYKQAISQLNHLFHTSDFPRKLVDSLENIDTTNIWADLK
jgi:tRNA 2-thiocytidine biosynthesis protein TtcA